MSTAPLVNRYLIQLLVLVSVICSHVDAAGVVKGTAINCEASNALLPFVDVYIFDSAKVPRLVSLIKTLESRKEDPEGKLFPPWFAEVMRIVKGTKPLVHTKTNRAGSFRSEIPSVGNVVVFGHAEVESEPFYYAYKQVVVSSRSNIDVVLDFGGGCSSDR